MLGFDAVGRLALGQLPPAATPVSITWFEPLAEPVRTRPRLKAGQVPFLAFDPQPFVSFGWFGALSIPALRTRPALRPPQYPAFVIDTAVIPIGRMNPWFAPLSEPVRKRSGLDAARQQFLASPSRLLPTPSITGTLNAIESGDVFTGGGREWNRVASGEVGIIERGFTGTEIGVSVTPISRASVSIVIL